MLLGGDRETLMSLSISLSLREASATNAALVLAGLMHEGSFYKPVAISPQFLGLSPD